MHKGITRIPQRQINPFEHLGHYELQIINDALNDKLQRVACAGVRNIIKAMQVNIKEHMVEIEDQWREKSVCHGPDRDEEDYDEES